MKKTILIIILVIVSSVQAFTQGKGHHKFDYDKFKAEKIAFITEAIELTPEEAQKFWPVYNEFEKKKWELIKSRHELENKLQEELKEMSKAEYVKLSEELAGFPIIDGKLNMEYNAKFLEILSPKKVVQLYIAEVNFRGKLLRKYRDSDKKDEN